MAWFHQDRRCQADLRTTWIVNETSKSHVQQAFFNVEESLQEDNAASQKFCRRTLLLCCCFVIKRSPKS